MRRAGGPTATNMMKTIDLLLSRDYTGKASFLGNVVREKAWVTREAKPMGLLWMALKGEGRSICPVHHGRLLQAFFGPPDGSDE